MQGALNAYEYNGAEQLRRELAGALVAESNITVGVLIGKPLAVALTSEAIITAGMNRARALAVRLESEAIITVGLTKLTVSSRGASMRRTFQGRNVRRVQAVREPKR